MLKPNFQAGQRSSPPKIPPFAKKPGLSNPVLKLHSARLRSRRNQSGDSRGVTYYDSMHRRVNSVLADYRLLQPSPTIRRMGNLYAQQSCFPGMPTAAQKLKASLLRRKRCNSEMLEQHAELGSSCRDFGVHPQQPAFFGTNVELHERLRFKRILAQSKIRNHYVLKSPQAAQRPSQVKKWSTESSIDYF